MSERERERERVEEQLRKRGVRSLTERWTREQLARERKRERDGHR